MNIAVIFAGGVGSRMRVEDKPKQFLMVHGKPIIVHTIEVFDQHPDIGGIVIACLEPWIPYMEEMVYRYRLDKVKKVVPGGETGQLSIYNGLKAAAQCFGVEDNIVLIHDGVRPLIDADTITRNIEAVKQYGSAITCTLTKETFILVDDQMHVQEIPNRSRSWNAKAPQSFYLKDILETQERAISEGLNNMIDSCTLMNHYGACLHVVQGEYDNLKITTPNDFYTFRALYDARENQQLM